MHEQLCKSKSRNISRTKLEKIVSEIDEIVKLKQATISPNESIPPEEDSVDIQIARVIDRDNIIEFKPTISLFRTVVDEIKAERWGEQIQEALESYSSDLSVYLPIIAVLKVLINNIKPCPIPIHPSKLEDLTQAWKKAAMPLNVLPYVMDYYILGQEKFRTLPTSQVPRSCREHILSNIELWHLLYATSSLHLSRNTDEESIDFDFSLDSSESINLEDLVDRQDELKLYRQNFASIISVVCKPKTEFECLLESLEQLENNGYSVKLFVKCKRLFAVLCAEEKDFFDEHTDLLLNFVTMIAKKDPARAFTTTECLSKKCDEYFELYAYILGIVLAHGINNAESLINEYMRELEKNIKRDRLRCNYEECYQALCGSLVRDGSPRSLRLIQKIADQIHEWSASKSHFYTTVLTLRKTFSSYREFFSWLPPDKYVCDVMTDIARESDGVATTHFDWMVKLIRETHGYPDHCSFVLSLGIHHTNRFAEALEEGKLEEALELCGYDVNAVIMEIFIRKSDKEDDSTYFKLEKLFDCAGDQKSDLLQSSVRHQLRSSTLNKALTTARMAIKLDRDHESSISDLFLLKIKNAYDSVQQLAFSNDSTDKTVEHVNTLCRFALRKSLNRDAISILEEALLIYPGNRKLLHYRVTMHMYKNEYSQMIDILLPLEAAVDPEIDFPKESLPTMAIYAFLYYAYIKLKRANDAQECLQRCKQLDLNVTHFRNIYISSFMEFDMFEEGMKVSRDPQFPYPNIVSTVKKTKR